MVFNSNIFLFAFLPAVLIIYYLINATAKKYTNLFILIASLLFYFWGESKFVLVLLASIIINYIFGILIGNSRVQATRKATMLLGVIVNLGLLFSFKYIDFTITTANSIFASNIPLLKIALPIGISFFTFQGLTYLIDLYYKNISPQTNFIKMALYISIFPQLVAGPIVRYKDISDQIDHRNVDLQGFSEGVKRFIFGLSKKVLIANTMGQIADNIFNLPFSEHSPWVAWLGAICYTLQIYYDFSGYSDMAIGLSKMFGFNIKENFNYPYISKSVSEFWRRWHISLSSFFRDYLYIPLGGNRTGNTYRNLCIVFLATGLWHGAAWHFVIWGLWHGAFIIAERLGSGLIGDKFKIPSPIKHIYLLVVVVVGWVFFRAVDLSYALGHIKVMFGIYNPEKVGLSITYYLNNYTAFILFVAIIGSTNLTEMVSKLFRNQNSLQKIVYTSQTFYLLLLMTLSIMAVMTSTFTPFIYFRF